MAPLREHTWGAIEIPAPKYERTGASLNSSPLCMTASLNCWRLCTSALGPHGNHGPFAPSHWGLVKLTAHVHERTRPQLKNWPLSTSALRGH